MGVTQGSVLAALLFVVLITPLSSDMRPYSPTINGVVMAPELFADDGTLIATNREMRAELLSLTKKWADRRNTVINALKSTLVTTADEAADELIDGLIFKEHDYVVYLGLGLTKGKMLPAPYERQLLSRMTNRLTALLKIGSDFGN